MSDVAENHGVDIWCYDALEPRVFALDNRARAVLRSLDVIETEFDTNPAYHVTRILATCAIEDYLARVRHADDRLADYLHDLRVPGATTHIVLDRGALSARAIEWWTIDGVQPDALPPDLPGDHAAGSVDESPEVSPPRPWRAVVEPGLHVVKVGLATRILEEHVTIARGERHVLRVY